MFQVKNKVWDNYIYIPKNKLTIFFESFYIKNAESINFTFMYCEILGYVKTKTEVKKKSFFNSALSYSVRVNISKTYNHVG